MGVINRVFDWVFDPVHIMLAIGAVLAATSNLSEDKLIFSIAFISGIFTVVVTLSTCAIIKAINEKKGE